MPKPKNKIKAVERYISLIDPPDAKAFYYCRITHKKKTYAKAFKLNELPLARAWVKSTANKAGKKLTGIIRPGITQRSNTGEKGISLGHKDGTPSLICNVLTDKGKRKATSFSIKKYGYFKAMQQALAWVREQNAS